MKICYFGDYDPGYARNRILIKGLKKNGIKVFECNNQFTGFFQKIKNLYSQHKRIGSDYDLIIVGYSPASRFATPLAWLISEKILVWDAFYSLYDAWVNDKKLVSKNSPKAWYYWFLDWLNCILADKILLDTDEHIKYFQKIFRIKKEKFIKVLVGSDDEIFYSREKKKSDKFLVHFHGNYIPLQGTEYIIKAAKILENEEIVFRMIGGRGQERQRAIALTNELGVKNILFHDSVKYDDLPLCIAEADICLGIFGDTEKTQRVIPNKIYEGIAMGKPVITADTSAIKEIFENKKNILLCRTADPKDLAEKTLELKNDDEFRKKISNRGNELFLRLCTPKIIAEKLIKEINYEIK